MTLRPPAENPPDETVASYPSVRTGSSDVAIRADVSSTSASSLSRTVIVALLAARPWRADWKTCELVSPSAGMLVWTSSTAGSASRIVSAWMVFSRTADELAPVGGAMVTIRVFSDPALMNWVGSSGASAAEAKKSTAANGDDRELGQPAAQDEA